MCKTYLDALGPDKSLGTLYGALVGLSALGNHIVRTLLIPQLRSIEERILGGERAAGPGASVETVAATATMTSSGSVAGSVAGSGAGAGGAMPPPVGAGAGACVAGEKRKRAGSTDNSGANVKSAGSSASASASATLGKGFNKASVSKQLQASLDVSMCKQALLRALGG